ncbi:MAG: hypothetical protein F6K17_02605 [Okeania sp. SIO3C4]|nr:hypothetical protein [Okeania sp. SIO3C4]
MYKNFTCHLLHPYFSEKIPRATIETLKLLPFFPELTFPNSQKFLTESKSNYYQR